MSDGPGILAANSDIELVHIGSERQRLAIIDGFLSDPDALVADAAAGDDYVAEPGNYYPGVRRPLAPAIAAAIARFADQRLRPVFAIAPERRPVTALAAFSIATRPPETLLPIQCIPHFDTSEPHQLAMVLYLCDPRHGGTSFYRHRATGYETITAERAERYRRTLEREASTVGLPKRDYIRGDSALFERTAAIEPRYNRAIFYHSNLLHAGAIDPASGLSPDPREGRLTATAFIRLER